MIYSKHLVNCYSMPRGKSRWYLHTRLKADVLCTYGFPDAEHHLPAVDLKPKVDLVSQCGKNNLQWKQTEKLQSLGSTSLTAATAKQGKLPH